MSTTAYLPLVVDLFAGPGGWDVAARDLGLNPIGLEIDAAACATRAAAGHRTIRCDVAATDPHPFAGALGLIASPPCQDWSTAGSGRGLEGDTGHLVREVMRWVEAIDPEWVACEQVPPALPVWEDYRDRLTRMGYRAWCGILNAADYGVPQTRKRAILMASRGPLNVPEPSHARHPEPGLFSTPLPWVTMAKALGWDGELAWTLRPVAMGDVRQSNGAIRKVDQPAPTITASADNGNFQWVYERPPTTVCADPRVADPTTTTARREGWINPATGKPWRQMDGAITTKLTTEQAAILQGFPPDYPWRGTKAKRFEQIGNAIPPPLARAILGALVTEREPALNAPSAQPTGQE